jgi:hypothetical protein
MLNIASQNFCICFGLYSHVWLLAARKDAGLLRATAEAQLQLLVKETTLAPYCPTAPQLFEV